MKKEQRFRRRLRDYDLDTPAGKLQYNRHLFTPVSYVYHTITKVLSFGRDASWKKKLTAMLPDCSNARVLDIACGPGDLSFLCASKYKDAKISGIDLNPDMLKKARENLNIKEPEIQNRIDFAEGNMNDLQYSSNQFDLITGGYALRNAPDLEHTLKEIHRVLKPGGTAAFLDFSGAAGSRPGKLRPALIAFWGRIWGYIYHRNAEVYGYISESIKRFPAKQEFLDLLDKTGFTAVNYKRLFMGVIFLIILRKKS